MPRFYLNFPYPVTECPMPTIAPVGCRNGCICTTIDLQYLKSICYKINNKTKLKSILNNKG